MRWKQILISFFLFLLLVSYQRLNPSEHVLSESIKQTSPDKNIIQITSELKQEAEIIRVIDGDTLEILLNGKKEKVRVIGINTPETVDPRKPVECFGKEASSVAKEILNNQVVELEVDSSQQNTDKYGRLLRYIFINNNDYGKFMIKNGYAFEYTYDLPYRYQLEYKQAEKQAMERKAGLWADNACIN